MFSDGRGVPQDDAHAIAWLRKAADQGNIGGLYSLGLMFQKAQDNGQAEKWSGSIKKVRRRSNMHRMGETSIELNDYHSPRFNSFQ